MCEVLIKLSDGFLTSTRVTCLIHLTLLDLITPTIFIVRFRMQFRPYSHLGPTATPKCPYIPPSTTLFSDILDLPSWLETKYRRSAVMVRHQVPYT
jgi:hypothetical protein